MYVWVEPPSHRRKAPHNKVLGQIRTRTKVVEGWEISSLTLIALQLDQNVCLHEILKELVIGSHGDVKVGDKVKFYKEFENIIEATFEPNLHQIWSECLLV